MFYIIKAPAGAFFAETHEPLDIDTVRRQGSIVLLNARRLWWMAGIQSLKGLAKRGTTKPSGCQVPCPIQFTTLYGVQDIVEATEACKASLDTIPEWTAWPVGTPHLSDDFDDRILVRTKDTVFFAKSAEPVDIIDGLPAMRLKDARRLRQWEGACSLSELAQRGLFKPETSIIDKLEPGTVGSNPTVEGVIEITCVTTKAASTLDAVVE